MRPTATTITDAALVAALAEAAGLPASADEIASAAAGLPALRASIAGLYAVPMDHEEDLSITFRA